jgi:hypothetical protein
LLLLLLLLLLLIMTHSGVDATHPDINYAGGISFVQPNPSHADDASEPSKDHYGHVSKCEACCLLLEKATQLLPSKGTGMVSQEGNSFVHLKRFAHTA